MNITFTLNGKKISRQIEADTLLIDLVRDLGCYSVKRGCETSNCGLCTVFMDDQPILSCSILAARVDGHKIDTLEGLQEEAAEFGAFIANQGAEQCGFCNPGMIMNAIALFREIPDPTEEEIKEVKEQITFMKKYREVLQFGTFYRLKSPFEGNETVWMGTNEDRTLAIVGYYRVLNGVNQPYSRVRLQGLNPDMVYENVWNHTENYGDELMNYGLITSDVTAGEVPGNVTPCTDFESRIYMLKGKKVQEGR